MCYIKLVIDCKFLYSISHHYSRTHTLHSYKNQCYNKKSLKTNSENAEGGIRTWLSVIQKQPRTNTTHRDLVNHVPSWPLHGSVAGLHYKLPFLDQVTADFYNLILSPRPLEVQFIKQKMENSCQNMQMYLKLTVLACFVESLLELHENLFSSKLLEMRRLNRKFQRVNFVFGKLLGKIKSSSQLPCCTPVPNPFFST